tara:strand:- start:44 stop:355 length:312 start_codon:yes stop_codon:yes gene_type:complete
MSNTKSYQVEWHQDDGYIFQDNFDTLKEANEDINQYKIEAGVLLEVTIDKDGNEIEKKKLYTFEEWRQMQYYKYRKEVEESCPEGFTVVWRCENSYMYNYVKK